MYIFNNAAVDKSTKSNRDHVKIYPGNPPAFFDLCHQQIQNKINLAWTTIRIGDMACVVSGTDRKNDPKRIDKIYIVEREPNKTIKNNDASVIRGRFIGVSEDKRRYNIVLKEHHVAHRYIAPEKGFFLTGFNVANISNQLDSLKIITTHESPCFGRILTVAELYNLLQIKHDDKKKIELKNITEYEVEEGYKQDRTLLFRQRNKEIIKKRKEIDNYTCKACGFRLEVNGNYIIDCHHKNPLNMNDDSIITKLDDLVCLCPTCHRISHSKRLPLTVEDIKRIRNIY